MVRVYDVDDELKGLKSAEKSFPIRFSVDQPFIFHPNHLASPQPALNPATLALPTEELHSHAKLATEIRARLAEKALDQYRRSAGREIDLETLEHDIPTSLNRAYTRKKDQTTR